MKKHDVRSQPKIQILVGKYSSYSLMVSFQESILRLAKSMLPFVFKKWSELYAAIRYLQDETTGDELVAAFNKAVTDGTRAGRIYELSMPYTRSESSLVARKLGARKAGLSRRKLTQDQVREIKRRHEEGGETIRNLALAYSVSRSLILRALYVY